MGRNIIVAAFLATFLVSLFLFFSRDDSSLRDQVDARSKQPVVTLEDFIVFRYDGHQLKGTLSGRLANFLEPNIIELYGNVQGKKLQGDQQNFASAESGTVFLSASGISQFLKDSTVRRATLENDVRIGVNQSVLNTEYAEFLAPNEKIQSDRPVLIYNSSGRFKGNTGFEYSLKSEDLVIFGPIEGLLQSGPSKRNE